MRIPLERNAFQTLAGGSPYGVRILGRRVERAIARHGLEIAIAKLESDRLAGVTFPAQVVTHAFAKVGEDLRQRLTVALRVEIAIEGELTTDRLRLAHRDDGAFV